MNRRRFLTTLLAGAAGVALDQTVPDVARRYFFPPTNGWNGRPGLAFHRDAFVGLFTPSPDIARQYREGLLVKIISSYEFHAAPPLRLDLFYGWATLRPELACRIGDETTVRHEGARARRRRKRQETFALTRPAGEVVELFSDGGTWRAEPVLNVTPQRSTRPGSSQEPDRLS